MVVTEIESAIGGFMSFLSKAWCHYSSMSVLIPVPTLNEEPDKGNTVCQRPE